MCPLPLGILCLSDWLSDSYVDYFRYIYIVEGEDVAHQTSFPSTDENIAA